MQCILDPTCWKKIFKRATQGITRTACLQYCCKPTNSQNMLPNQSHQLWTSRDIALTWTCVLHVSQALLGCNHHCCWTNTTTPHGGSHSRLTKRARRMLRHNSRQKDCATRSRWRRQDPHNLLGSNSLSHWPINVLDRLCYFVSNPLWLISWFRLTVTLLLLAGGPFWKPVWQIVTYVSTFGGGDFLWTASWSYLDFCVSSSLFQKAIFSTSWHSL